MDNQCVIVVVSILIGFSIGWPVGSWRVRKFYRTLLQRVISLTPDTVKKD